MKRIYPIVLSPGDDWWLVYVPDFEINTQGRDMEEALYMAHDAIGAVGVCKQDAGQEIPEPSTFEPEHEKGELVSWVSIDFELYRYMSDMTSERTNVTLPRYLKVAARRAGLNLSQELQMRIKEVLML